MNKKTGIKTILALILSLISGVACGTNYTGTYVGNASFQSSGMLTGAQNQAVTLSLNQNGSTLTGSLQGTGVVGTITQGIPNGTTVSSVMVNITSMGNSMNTLSSYLYPSTTLGSSNMCGTGNYQGSLSLVNNQQLTGTLSQVSSSTLGCGTGSFTLNATRNQT